MPRTGRDPATRTVLAAAVAGGLMLTGHFMLYTYVASLLGEVGGYDAAARTALLVVFGLAGLVGIAVSGPLSDRFPRYSLGGVGAALAGSAAALVWLGVDPVVAVVVVAVWGALIGVLPPVFQTRLLRVPSPGREAAAGAVGVTVLNLGIAAGAAAGAAVVGVRGPGALPLGAAAVIAVAVLALRVGGRRRADGAAAGVRRPRPGGQRRV